MNMEFDDARKMPVGIQDFEYLRANDYLYVDKTVYLHRLLRGKTYFLGRPRRFGKSLFLSTLKAYFLGKRHLFEGLAIAGLEKEWLEYPVLYIDMNVMGYSDLDSLYQALDANLRMLEERWGRDEADTSPATRFWGLIRRAGEKSGRGVVVLVDEYDKPLVNTLDKEEINAAMRDILKGFYGVLKSADAYLRFVFLTGVTKFSKVSIFSDLNHLMDISMDNRYAGICGISQSELVANFQPEIEALAAGRKMSREEVLDELKKRYDGYHFAKEGENIYNPFSLLNTFEIREFNNYWFATGTPTFLVKMLKSVDFDIRTLESDVRISPDSIADYRPGHDDPVPILYQSGYLTVKSYDERLNEYILGFPNGEVKYGFFNELLPAYVPEKNTRGEFHAARFVEELFAGNVEGFMTRLQAFFAGIPYELNNKGEKHYQTVFYLLFKLMGQFVEVEHRGAAGRADAVVATDDALFVFEFKLAGRATAEEALRQIDEKGYLLPFAARGKRLVKVGVEFSETDRGIARWVVG